jgi:hypothetical protein
MVPGQLPNQRNVAVDIMLELHGTGSLRRQPAGCHDIQVKIGMSWHDAETRKREQRFETAITSAVPAVELLEQFSIPPHTAHRKFQSEVSILEKCPSGQRGDAHNPNDAVTVVNVSYRTR